MSERFDCVIIGAGIAGITAGIYLKRSNLSAVVLDKDAPGGKLNNIHRIDNYPGTPSISGPELAAALYNQASELGVTFDYGAVSEVRKDDEGFLVVTDMNTYVAKTVIVATGIEKKKLGVPGEAEFNGKGVSYCATCDGNFFKGKTMVVYGYKDHAVEDALYLSSLADQVILLAPQPIETTEAHMDQLLHARNIRRFENVTLTSIDGNEHVEGVTFVNNGDDYHFEFPCAAVFQLYGEKSSGMFLSSLGVENNKGFLCVNANMETNVPGLFACGDVIDKRLRQLVNAAGEGSVAATSAIAYIHSKK